MRPYGHIFPKTGRSLDTAHPRLCVGIFKYCWTEGFVLFLILFSWTGLSGEDQVEQSPQTLRTQEGNGLILNCSYTASSFKGLQWYRQDPGKGPELLFLLHSVGDEKQKERLRATLLKKGSSLHIETINLKTQPLTSALWRHNAPQAPADCTQTLKLEL